MPRVRRPARGPGADDPLITVLRAEVRTETATPTVEELVLIFGGRFLDNSERLTEINGDRGPIEDKTTLHVMVRFKADGPGAQTPRRASSRWIDGLSQL